MPQKPQPVPGSNAKIEQMKQYVSDNKGQKTTTNKGVKVENDDDSLKAGLRGPTLLEDFKFREKITHFDHERIPERVVHARGSGAHGVFKPYKCWSEYTTAAFLQDPNKETPVFVRFSTVAGSRGSADTVRDVRGFAVRFYTEEGNYDIVGNNIPVFFIQDAIKFPDIIHAVKPEPNHEMPQASSAHDTFWDFIAAAPETTHMVMWVMSDRAIPRSYRMMEGFGVNTFRMINAEGKGRFVKFHWKPALGVHSLVWDEAQKLAGKNPDFHRKDLWEAIDQGNYPEYELGIQVIEEEREFDFDFDILDPTKLWPEELIPVQILGRMTLNKNPDNFFAETEQVAFCPANIVPGIDFSNDPLLQGRLFSYEDTQLSRLGGPNFHEIPINRPLAPVHNNQRDGMHRMTVNPGQVAYFPSVLGDGGTVPAKPEEGAFVHYTQKVEGSVIRARSESFNDHFTQARLFWNSMSAPEKKNIVDAFTFELNQVVNKEIRQKIADRLAHVDLELAKQVADNLDLNPPAPPMNPATHNNASPALSQLNTVKSAATRKCAILIAPGCCAKSVKAVIKALTDAGVNHEFVGTEVGRITAKDGTAFEAAKDFHTTSSVLYDAFFVPGGKDSAPALTACAMARAFLCEAYMHKKPVAASDEGIDFLSAAAPEPLPAGAKGKPGESAAEHGILTVRGVDDFKAFADAFVPLIAEHRFWDRAVC